MKLDLYTLWGYIYYMDNTKKKVIQHLKIIEGQIRGLQSMVRDDVYCIDVITQTSAIKQALSRVEDTLMEHHLSTCVVKQIKKGKEKKAQEEILTVYRLKRK